MDLAVPRLATAHRGLLDRPLAWAALLAVCAFAVYHFSFPDETPFDQYVLLADALLHGRVDLVDPPYHIEKTTFRGRHYVMNPPFPAIVLLPYVAIRGQQASQAATSHVVGALAAGLMFLLASRLAPRREDALWLGALGAFGTIVWYLSAVGSIWYFAHVVAVTVMLLGVLEATGRQRPVLIGCAIAAAYWTRMPTILTLPFFVLATLPKWAPGGLRDWRRIDVGYLERLLAPVAAMLALNMGYNYVRFGTIADIGAAVRPGIYREPWFDRGLFHPSYISRHLTLLFTKLPVFVPHPPYALVPWTGLAIWITTPAFVYALRAPAVRETLAAWSGILPAALGLFMFGNPGVTQFGYRFATDFYPLLLLLTFRGMGGRPSRLAKVLIAAAVIVNAWGVLGARWGWQAP